jgi:hypothetical protein
MIADTVGSLLLFVLLSFGPGWWLAARLHATPAERLVASVALSWLALFLAGWTVYVAALRHAWFWGLPALAVAGLAAGWRPLRELWRDPEARELVLAQAVVTAWCVGWLALVASYSGGAWMGDWFGHWQRADFFLQRGPLDIRFNGFDALTSRPPLANVVFGVGLALTRPDFAHYQLVLTFLGTLAFLPAALLARRFAPATGPAQRVATIRVLAVLFLVSPMFVQNATFAWTKLHAAFFTLAALHFLLRAPSADFPRAGILFSVTLAGALLTHYSAGPYALVFAAAWVALGAGRWREAAWWKDTAVAAGAGFAVLATWFGWALAVYGPRGTFLTNTSVTDQAATSGAQLATALLNVRDTLVPHFLRTVDPALITQSSPWGAWRDWFFQLYQVNLVFIFGSLTWLAVLAALVVAARSNAPRPRLAWSAGIVAVILLGVMVHAGRDTWGLAHICLQPLVLAGLALLAAHWRTLNSGWRRIVVAGAALDVALGIALHFGAQSFLLDQWLAPGRSAAETFASYSPVAQVNWRAKLHFRHGFFGDAFAGYDVVLLLLLALLLGLALMRVRRTPAAV